MKLVYPVIFSATHDKKDTYLIEIPDINGFSEGYGLSDAIAMARDYIGGHCYKMSESETPKASRISDIRLADSAFEEEDAFISLVDVDLDAYRKKMESRAVRKNVSIPAWLDKAAEDEQLNLSRVLQEALIQKLNVS